jgi:hypothetical protein
LSLTYENGAIPADARVAVLAHQNLSACGWRILIPEYALLALTNSAHVVVIYNVFHWFLLFKMVVVRPDTPGSKQF